MRRTCWMSNGPNWANEPSRGALANTNGRITGNTISNAGTYGIQLIGAVSPVVKNNILLTTGFTGTSAGTHFPAAYLNGVSGGDFVTNITGNKGFGNNLDAIAFHGSTGPLSWLSVQVNGAATNPLGYLVEYEQEARRLPEDRPREVWMADLQVKFWEWKQSQKLGRQQSAAERSEVASKTSRKGGKTAQAPERSGVTSKDVDHPAQRGAKVR